MAKSRTYEIDWVLRSTTRPSRKLVRGSIIMNLDQGCAEVEAISVNDAKAKFNVHNVPPAGTRYRIDSVRLKRSIPRNHD